MRLRFIHKGYLIIGLLVVIATGLTSFTAPDNEADISNGIIKAHLYLPDATNGFYRGLRFDWSGIISSLESNGHTYYGNWFLLPYKPTNNDAVMGPAEAFDPIGYDSVKASGTFVKIGVGTLIKPDDSAYIFKKSYPVANPGQWKVKIKTDEAIFTHTLNDTAYSYKYQKTVQLVKGKSILILSHTLKNTGHRTIQTSVFDHNFLMLDQQPVGPGLVLTYPFDIGALPNRRADYVKLQGNQMIFQKTLDKLIMFNDLTAGKGSDKYNIIVENHATGAAVKITADRPIAKFAFWCTPKTICPEPYINIKVNPGQTFTWAITYEYYSCAITKN